MDVIGTIFDNRELALLCWLGVLAGVGFVSKSLRPSFLGIAKTLFASKLTAVLALMAAYAGLLVYLLHLAGVWTADLTGETIFWFFGPAFVLFMKLSEASEDQRFLRRTFLSVLSLTVLIEFVVNLYVLKLWAELLLVPLLVFLGAMLAVAVSLPEYKQVRALLNFITAAVGFAFLSYAVYRIAKSPGDFATLSTAREFTVPLVLTLGLLPFIYVAALMFAYELMFLRLRWKLDRGPLYPYAKRKALWVANFRLRSVRRLSAAYPAALLPSSSRAEIDREVRRIVGH